MQWQDVAKERLGMLRGELLAAGVPQNIDCKGCMCDPDKVVSEKLVDDRKLGKGSTSGRETLAGKPRQIVDINVLLRGNPSLQLDENAVRARHLDELLDFFDALVHKK